MQSKLLVSSDTGTVAYNLPQAEVRIEKESIANYLMPNDSINGWSIPLPNSLTYDTLADLLTLIKNYCKEAGFSIVVEDKNHSH